jgi:hypothetical protein
LFRTYIRPWMVTHFDISKVIIRIENILSYNIDVTIGNKLKRHVGGGLWVRWELKCGFLFHTYNYLRVCEQTSIQIN